MIRDNQSMISTESMIHMKGVIFCQFSRLGSKIVRLEWARTPVKELEEIISNSSLLTLGIRSSLKFE